MIPPNLTTERLLLRPAVEADAAALFHGVASDPRVTRYMDWRTNRSVEETLAFLRSVNRPDGAGERVMSICLADSPDDPIGTLGAERDGPRVTVGYVLAHRHWGHGYMTEALGAFTDAWLAVEGVWRIQAWRHVDNTASARVLERVGFELEGTARRRNLMPQIGPMPQDCCVHALVREP
ncbi:MAG: GNAT family N-acetyltransferase [Planctomycetota bacterium]